MNVLGEDLRPTADLHPLHPFWAPGWSFDLRQTNLRLKTASYICQELIAPVYMYLRGRSTASHFRRGVTSCRVGVRTSSWWCGRSTWNWQGSWSQARCEVGKLDSSHFFTGKPLWGVRSEECLLYRFVLQKVKYTFLLVQHQIYHCEGGSEWSKCTSEKPGARVQKQGTRGEQGT